MSVTQSSYIVPGTKNTKCANQTWAMLEYFKFDVEGLDTNVKGPNSLSLAWLKVIISWSHINFVWIVSKLYMYPSIIMRSCLSFMGKHNIRTKVLESVFFSANPLLNIFTQTLSLKSHKKSICEVFTCAPFQMLQLHGKTSRKYMYRNLQFMLSDFSF